MLTAKMNDLLNNLSNFVPVSFSYVNDEGETRTITYTASTVRQVLTRYCDWSVRAVFDTDIEFSFPVIMNYFYTYSKERFNRMFKALDLEYNPTHNYDKLSDITTSHVGNITHNGITSDTNVFGAVSGSATEPSMTSTTAEGSFDGNGVLTDSMRVTSSGGTATTTTNEHTNTNNGTNNLTDTFNNDDIVTEHTRGNIGVAMTSDIITNELALRSIKNDLIHLYLHELMCEYGYLLVSSEY